MTITREELLQKAVGMVYRAEPDYGPPVYQSSVEYSWGSPTDFWSALEWIEYAVEEMRSWATPEGLDVVLDAIANPPAFAEYDRCCAWEMGEMDDDELQMLTNYLLECPHLYDQVRFEVDPATGQRYHPWPPNMLLWMLAGWTKFTSWEIYLPKVAAYLSHPRAKYTAMEALHLAPSTKEEEAQVVPYLEALLDLPGEVVDDYMLEEIVETLYWNRTPTSLALLERLDRQNPRVAAYLRAKYPLKTLPWVHPADAPPSAS